MNLEQMIKAKEDGKCPFCGKDMSNPSFKDKRSKREFEISGMCQECQDGFFNNKY